MNKTERKQQILDIINTLNDCVTDIKSNTPKIAALTTKIEQLNSEFEDLPSEVYGWNHEELISSLHKAIIDGSNLEDLRDQTYHFKSEFDEYMSGLTESKREPLEDIYGTLGDIVESFTYEQGEEIDDFLSRLDDAKNMLLEILEMEKPKKKVVFNEEEVSK